MFTIAHTLTIALVALEVVSPDGDIIEPLIAFSIGLIAVESLVFKTMHWWRLPVVFGFGLLHGLGFGNALAESGLPSFALPVAILGFNVGVELGQLVVVAASVTALWLAARAHCRTRARVLAVFVITPAAIACASTLEVAWWYGAIVGPLAVLLPTASRNLANPPTEPQLPTSASSLGAGTPVAPIRRSISVTLCAMIALTGFTLTLARVFG